MLYLCGLLFDVECFSVDEGEGFGGDGGFFVGVLGGEADLSEEFFLVFLFAEEEFDEVLAFISCFDVFIEDSLAFLGNF